MARVRSSGRLAFATLLLLSTLDGSLGGKGGGNQQSCKVINPLAINKRFVAFAPYEIVKPVGGVEVKRHHIIAKSRLIEFFNKVTEQDCAYPGELKKIAPILKKLAKYATDYSLRYPNILFHPDTIAKLREQNEITADEANNVYRIGIKVADKITAGKISSLDAPVKDSLDARGFGLLKIMYVWNPFNIMIGPGARSDDPNDSFEEHANEIIGNSDFRVLKQLNDHMDTYIKSGGNLDTIVTLLSGVVKERQIDNEHAYGFNPSKWILENGKYKIVTQNSPGKTKVGRGNRGGA